MAASRSIGPLAQRLAQRVANVVRHSERLRAGPRRETVLLVCMLEACGALALACRRRLSRGASAAAQAEWCERCADVVGDARQRVCAAMAVATRVSDTVPELVPLMTGNVHALRCA